MTKTMNVITTSQKAVIRQSWNTGLDNVFINTGLQPIVIITTSGSALYKQYEHRMYQPFSYTINLRPRM